MNAITFDVTVDSDAECGPRDIVLSSLEYPDERYIVFGFIDVYDDPVMTVSDGPESPAVRSFTSALADSSRPRASLRASALSTSSWCMSSSSVAVISPLLT